jgi:hypothetical protein
MSYFKIPNSHSAIPAYRQAGAIGTSQKIALLEARADKVM